MARKSKHPVDDLTLSLPTTTETPTESQDAAGKPKPSPKAKKSPQGSPETRSSNVTLPLETWEWIDAKHAEARTSGGKALRKSAIIRAVFDMAMSVDVDVSGVQSEAEITQRLIRAVAQQHN